MKIAILTANGMRHRFVANFLAERSDDALVIAECRASEAPAGDGSGLRRTPIEEHFHERYRVEQEFFAGNDSFRAPVLPVLYKEASGPEVYRAFCRFKPDMVFVYGSSIIREPLLSAFPAGKSVNMHLGLSPYYRGAGTNFWPFVNGELEYVGATLLHIDAGIDTGDIAAHVRPRIEIGDTVHTVGCKVIRDGAAGLARLIELTRTGAPLPRVPQWEIPDGRYYRNADFTEETLAAYRKNIDAGLVARYVGSQKKAIRLVPLE